MSRSQIYDGSDWVDMTAAAAGGGQSVPIWLEHLTDRTVGGESVHGDDDEFDDETVDAAWTAITPSGTATWEEARGVLSCAFEDQSANDWCPQLKTMTPSTSPVTIETVVDLGAWYGSFPMIGLLFADGVTAAANATGFYLYQYNDTLYIEARSGTIGNIATGEIAAVQISGRERVYLRLIWKSANTWQFQWSPNGVQWLTSATWAFTMTPTQLGGFVSSWTETDLSIASFEYFRVTESDLAS